MSHKRTSIYWKHFENHSNGAVCCKLCLKNGKSVDNSMILTSNNTTNLKIHLERHHKTEYVALIDGKKLNGIIILYSHVL